MISWLDRSVLNEGYESAEKRIGVVLLVASLVLAIAAGAVAVLVEVSGNLEDIKFMNSTLHDLQLLAQDEFSYLGSGTELRAIGTDIRIFNFPAMAREFLENFNVSSTDEEDWLRNDNPLVLIRDNLFYLLFSAIGLATASVRTGLLLYVPLHMIDKEHVITVWTKCNFLLMLFQLIVCVLATLQVFVVYDQITLLAIGVKGLAASHQVTMIVQWICISVLCLVIFQFSLNVQSHFFNKKRRKQKREKSK